MAPVFGRLQYDLALSGGQGHDTFSKQSNVVHHILCSCGHAGRHWGNQTENADKSGCNALAIT